MEKERIYGFLSELYDALESDETLQLPEDTLFNEILESVESNAIFAWRERVDSVTVDLANRWLEEEIDWQSVLPRWNDLYYDDPMLSPLLRRLTKLVVTWKEKLTEALSKDTGLFTIPPDIQSPTPSFLNKPPA